MLAFRTLLALALVAGAAGAEATIVEALTLSRALELCSDVVTGQVVDSHSLMESNGVIYTETSVRVDEALHGPGAPDGIVVVRELGGVVGSIGMTVEGVARFELGERVLLFLEPAGESARRTVGLYQGAYTLSELDGVTTALQKPSDGALSAGQDAPGRLPERMQLVDFVGAIRLEGGAR